MKQAYPNLVNAPEAKKPYNLNKWVSAMKDIYTNIHFGKDYQQAFQAITANWEPVEKFDFQAWMDYYQGDNQHKYKTAQHKFYVNDTMPGYFIPNAPVMPSPISPIEERKDTNYISDPASEARKSVEQLVSKEEQHKRTEEHRKKIISRLNAAVRLLTHNDGHKLTGTEFKRLLGALYDLIEEFQGVNKVSLSNRLYYDLIIRQSNRLSREGFDKSASFLVKLAQNSAGQLDASGPLPIGTAGTGVIGGNLGNPVPPLQALPSEDKKEDDEEENSTLSKILEQLETGGITVDNDKSDDNEISLDNDEEEELTIEAQMMPVQNPIDQGLPPAPPPTEQEPNLEVSLEEELPDETPDHVDARIGDALSGITIEDVISKLENVNSAFRNRKLSRELNLIDLMLDQLGMVSLFPQLAECNQKLLESHSYIINRLETVISQLNGAISKSNIDIVSENMPVNEDVKRLRDTIEEDQAKDKLNREKRRRIRDEIEDGEIKVPPKPPTPSVLKPSPIPPAQQIESTPVEIV